MRPRDVIELIVRMKSERRLLPFGRICNGEKENEKESERQREKELSLIHI